MANPHKLTVGQKLWFQSRVKYRTSHEVTVSKIGSRWATINNDVRISLETLAMDGAGYSSPGQCWISQQECDLAQEIRAAWDQLRLGIDHKYEPPDGVTLENLRETARQLQIPMTLKSPQGTP